MSETWLMNKVLTVPENHTMSASIQAFHGDSYDYSTVQYNEETYSNLTLLSSGAQNPRIVYEYTFDSDPSNIWFDESYRTWVFLEKPTGDMLTWLQENGVKQVFPGLKNLSSYNQDLSVPRKKDLDALETNVQTQLNNKVPTTRTVNNKALSSNITLTASDVDAIAAKDGTGTGTTSLEHLTVKEVEIDSNTANGGALYGNGIINLKSIVAEAGTPSFTLHASGPNNRVNEMNMYSDHTTIELSDDSGTRGLIIHAPDSQSGLDEDGMIIDCLARIAPEAAGTTYRSAPLTGAFYTNVIKPYTLPSVSTTNNLDMLMVVNGAWQTDHDTAGIQNAASLIVNKWPDNVTIVVKSFRRWGKLCLFTVQINVGTAISTNYGFTLLEMPYTSVDRVWINNQTQFYMDSNNVAVRVNNANLATGNYTLTGFYLTTDNARVVS